MDENEYRSQRKADRICFTALTLYMLISLKWKERLNGMKCKVCIAYIKNKNHRQLNIEKSRTNRPLPKQKYKLEKATYTRMYARACTRTYIHTPMHAHTRAHTQQEWF